MKKKLYLPILLFFLFFSTCLTGCEKQNEKISKSGFYFNTVITITIYDASKEELLEDCFALADQYEHYFSNKIADSDISRINASGGTPVEVHDETLELLQKGIDYGELSHGKFDITIGKLSDLWDFSTKALIEESEMNDSYLPTDTEIQSALATVNYQNVILEGNSVRLADPDASIDLGGIAKGYIADKMKEFLNENGVISGNINLGGNVLVLGPKPDKSASTIGIQYPFKEDGTPIASIQVTDESVVSSGVYERYFQVDGTLYHHILDTGTGYPYDNNLLGVTVITRHSVDGDGLSTTCFALGLEDGMALIESLPDTEAIFITNDYKLHTSSGIGSTIPFQKY